MRLRFRFVACPLLPLAVSTVLLLLTLLWPTRMRAQDQPPTGVPSVIHECENTLCSDWKWNNGHFEAYWQGNGAAATLEMRSFTAESVLIERTDTPTSFSKGMTANYTGQISSDGNSIVNGKVEWTWPNAPLPGYPARGEWTGTWDKTCPALPVVGDIVVYRQALNSDPVHSGVISHTECQKAEDGKLIVTITLVVSKWGDRGLYEHDPNDVPTSYGQWVAFHSNRGSNLLAKHVEYGITHYVTDKTASQVELFYADQFLRDIKVPLSIAQARDAINQDPWWANPTGKTSDQGGKPLYRQLTARGEPTFKYDCHGYTFANADVWINNDKVHLILDENGYIPVQALDTHGQIHK